MNLKPNRSLLATGTLLVFLSLVLGLFLPVSCVAAAVFGTSRATPLAGAGFGGLPWQEVTVSLGLGVFSIATLIAVGVLLVGFLRNR